MTGEADGSLRPIGGFFALGLDDVPPADGAVWHEWTRHSRSVSTFLTGREALVALIAASRPRRVWLPAYYCRDVTDAVAAAAAKISAEVHTYGLTENLDPDAGPLNAELAAGDLAVVVDYFGWLPSEPFRDWTRKRPDVLWVEDRAQALWTADPPWAAWSIFSPRKVLGVPDGGLLMGGRVLEPRAQPEAPSDVGILLPEVMRFEDRAEKHSAHWHKAYEERERAFAGASGPMSRLTRSLLERIPLAPLVSARQANYDYLAHRLRDFVAWRRDAKNVAPFGLVIAVENAQSLSRRLAAERLFCARHWAQIGSGPARFPYEHRLSEQLLTLPCDHRYRPEQLARLADAIERLAPRPGCVRSHLG